MPDANNYGLQSSQFMVIVEEELEDEQDEKEWNPPVWTNPWTSPGREKLHLIEDEFTEKECSVIQQLVHCFRPFTPKRRPKSDDAPSGSRSTQESTACLATSSGILEVLCSLEENSIDIVHQGGMRLNTVQGSGIDKDVIFGSFFDIEKTPLLTTHILDMIIYEDLCIICHIGKVILHGPQRAGYPVRSSYEASGNRNKGRGGRNWHQELMKIGFNKAEIEARSEEATAMCTSLESAVNEARKRLSNKVAKEGAKSSAKARKEDLESDTAVAPWTHHHVEDTAEKLNIQQLIADNNKNNKRKVIFAGTDYGLVTMSETSALTLSEVHSHMNRYQVLYDHDKTENQDEQETLATMTSPSPTFKVTTARINHATFSRRAGRRRELRLRHPMNKE
ncbi:hypothetical protein KVV02_006684 [Mortierella alpina]|uniref:Uncharacterized protein n=1 Tax=Mortierella alpina TaxID=64518 RepID=A0A9P7ZWE4_MORAP|nr:hypothetical protein KVV02_006684 [Mortierella alpina]